MKRLVAALLALLMLAAAGCSADKEEQKPQDEPNSTTDVPAQGEEKPEAPSGSFAQA